MLAVFYEKDKMIPVDPRRVPALDDAKLQSFPYGYRHLGYCQAGRGHKVLMTLPEAKGEKHDLMYQAMSAWVDGANEQEMEKLLEIERS